MTPTRTPGPSTIAHVTHLGGRQLAFSVTTISAPRANSTRHVAFACHVTGVAHPIAVGAGTLRDPSTVHAERTAQPHDTRPFAFGGRFEPEARQAISEFVPVAGSSLGDVGGLAAAICVDCEEGWEDLCWKIQVACGRAWERWRVYGGYSGSDGEMDGEMEAGQGGA